MKSNNLDVLCPFNAHTFFIFVIGSGLDFNELL